MGKCTNLGNTTSHRLSAFHRQNPGPSRQLKFPTDGLKVITYVMSQSTQQFSQRIGSGKFIIKLSLLGVKTPCAKCVAPATRMNDGDLPQPNCGGLILGKETITTGNFFLSSLKFSPGRREGIAILRMDS